MLLFVFRLIASAGFAYLSSLAIIACGVWWYCSLVCRASRRLRPHLDPPLQHLDKLRQKREETTHGQDALELAAIEELDEAFPASSPLRQAWEEFRATLVEHDGRIWRTTSAHAFFNPDRILGAYFDLRHISLAPNTLTGLGILGTFLGLVAGIHLGHRGLLLDRIDQMRASLFDLLAGASTAFWTSVAGLFASLLFGWMSRKALNESADRTRRLADALDDCMGLRPPEWFMADALGELRKQTAELRHFNTDLITSIASALDERLAARLVPHFQALLSAVDGLREAQVLFNQETVGQLLGQFSQQLAHFAGREMEALVNAIRDARESLSQASQSLSEERARAAQSWNAGLAHFEAGMRSVHEQLAAAGLPLLEAVHQWEVQLSRAEGLLQQVASAAGNVREALDGASQAVQVAAEGLRTSTDGLQAALKGAASLLETSEGASRQVQAAVLELRQASDGLAQAASELRLQAQAITSTWEAQRGRFEGLDQALEDAFARFATGMKDALDKAGDILGEAHDHLSDALKSLSGFVQETSELVNEVRDLLVGLRPSVGGTSDGTDREPV